MELNFNEAFLIHVLREFDFLREWRYDVVSVSIYRDPGVVFANSRAGRTVIVSWEGDLVITINRKRRSFWGKEESSMVLSNYYHNFGFSYIKVSNAEEKISQNASLIRTKLVKLLEGKSWIDEILSQ
jgi:hypothetical protein